jgi:phospholipase D1/2
MVKECHFQIFSGIKYENILFRNSHQLKETQGYFTNLSINWTSGEDNLIPYNMKLIASIENHDYGINQVAQVKIKD